MYMSIRVGQPPEIPTTEPERATGTILEGVGVEHLPPFRMREKMYLEGLRANFRVVWCVSWSL